MRSDAARTCVRGAKLTAHSKVPAAERWRGGGTIRRMSFMQTLTLTRPDDWHLHVRDGAGDAHRRAAQRAPVRAARSSCRT